MSEIIDRNKEDVIKMLGPIQEANVEVKLPIAFIEYINEKAVEKYRWSKNLEEYCNRLILELMIANVDNDKDMVLSSHTIPGFLAYYDDGIINATLGRGLSK
jgi:hypothetical protein